MGTKGKTTLSVEWVTVRGAGEALGVGKIRILNLINAPCPHCEGMGEIETGLKILTCPRCRGNGHRLPAIKFGKAGNSPWMIFDWALELPDIVERKPGNPKTRKPGTGNPA